MEIDKEEELHEIEEKIESLEKITKDNNRVLRSIQSHMRMSTLMNVLYYVVIVGSMIGLYYYFQPFINEFIKTQQYIISIPDKIKQLGK